MVLHKERRQKPEFLIMHKTNRICIGHWRNSAHNNKKKEQTCDKLLLKKKNRKTVNKLKFLLHSTVKIRATIMSMTGTQSEWKQNIFQ